MALTASTVSRKLRAAGFGIVATRNREGIRVSGGALPGYVNVSFDLDRDGERGRLSDTLEEWVAQNTTWTYRRLEDQFTLTEAAS